MDHYTYSWLFGFKAYTFYLILNRIFNCYKDALKQQQIIGDFFIKKKPALNITKQRNNNATDIDLTKALFNALRMFEKFHLNLNELIH